MASAIEILTIILGLCLASACLLRLRGLSSKHRKAAAAAKLPEGSMGWPLIGETLSFLSPHRSNSPGTFLLEHCSRYANGWQHKLQEPVRYIFSVINNSDVQSFLANLPSLSSLLVGLPSLFMFPFNSCTEKQQDSSVELSDDIIPERLQIALVGGVRQVWKGFQIAPVRLPDHRIVRPRVQCLHPAERGEAFPGILPKGDAWDSGEELAAASLRGAPQEAPERGGQLHLRCQVHGQLLPLDGGAVEGDDGVMERA